MPETFELIGFGTAFRRIGNEGKPIAPLMMKVELEGHDDTLAILVASGKVVNVEPAQPITRTLVGELSRL